MNSRTNGPTTIPTTIPATSSMKLLVTGGAGYIGSHTVHQLTEAGHEVTVLDNLCTGHRWAVPNQVSFVAGDVGDTSLIHSLLRSGSFDAVLHFAAFLEVRESVEEPLKYYRNNTLAALGLFDACLANGVNQVIFSSTAAVYGEPVVPLIDEEQLLQPLNPYGASKMMTERILADLARASGDRLRFVALRYFNVAGARFDLRIGQGGPKSYHLIKVAAEAALGVRKGMAIHGSDYPTPDGTCLRDYIHVEDLARAHVDALVHLNQGGQSNVFNVGYGRPYSVREVIETMKRVSGVDFQVAEGPRRAGDPAVLAADSSKIKRVLGWKPKHEDLDLICRTALEWERVYQEKYKIR